MYVRMYVCPHLCSVYTYVRSLVLFLNAVCEREALVHGATEKDSSYTFTYTRTFIRTYVCVHFVCVCLYICVCMYVCLCVCRYICAYMPVVNPFTGVLYCTYIHMYVPVHSGWSVVGSGKTWACSARCQRSWMTDPYLSLVYPFSSTASLPLPNVQGTHISAFTHEGC